jgi:hypothetical protein
MNRIYDAPLRSGMYSGKHAGRVLSFAHLCACMHAHSHTQDTCTHRHTPTACVHAHKSYMHAYIRVAHTHTHTHMHAYIHTYIHTYIHGTCTYTYMHSSCLHVQIDSIGTCQRTYIYGYIHEYAHMHIKCQSIHKMREYTLMLYVHTSRSCVHTSTHTFMQCVPACTLPMTITVTSIQRG